MPGGRVFSEDAAGMTEWRVEGGERGLCISFFVHQLYAMEQTTWSRTRTVGGIAGIWFAVPSGNSICIVADYQAFSSIQYPI